MRPEDIRKADSLRCAGDQPRVSARRAQPGAGEFWPTGGGNRLVAMGGSPGSPEFPSSLVWMQPADRPWCARLTAVIRPLGKWRAAGTPRSATSRASVVSWDDRGTTPSSSPNSRGGGARHRCTRIAWLCSSAAGQQGSSRGSCLLSNLAKASYTLHYITWTTTTFPSPPSEPGNSIYIVLHRPGCLLLPSPPAHGWGRFHPLETCGPHARKARKAGLLLLLLLRPPGVGRAGWQAVRTVCLSGRRGACDADPGH